MKTLRTAHVRVSFDKLTHIRLAHLAKLEGKSLTGMIREMAERRAAPVMVLARKAVNPRKVVLVPPKAARP